MKFYPIHRKKLNMTNLVTQLLMVLVELAVALAVSAVLVKVALVEKVLAISLTCSLVAVGGGGRPRPFLRRAGNRLGPAPERPAGHPDPCGLHRRDAADFQHGHAQLGLSGAFRRLQRGSHRPRAAGARQPPDPGAGP